MFRDTWNAFSIQILGDCKHKRQRKEVRESGKLKYILLTHLVSFFCAQEEAKTHQHYPWIVPWKIFHTVVFQVWFEKGNALVCWIFSKLNRQYFWKRRFNFRQTIELKNCRFEHVVEFLANCCIPYKFLKFFPHRFYSTAIQEHLRADVMACISLIMGKNWSLLFHDTTSSSDLLINMAEVKWETKFWICNCPFGNYCYPSSGYCVGAVKWDPASVNQPRGSTCIGCKKRSNSLQNTVL